MVRYGAYWYGAEIPKDAAAPQHPPRRRRSRAASEVDGFSAIQRGGIKPTQTERERARCRVRKTRSAAKRHTSPPALGERARSNVERRSRLWTSCCVAFEQLQCIQDLKQRRFGRRQQRSSSQASASQLRARGRTPSSPIGCFPQMEEEVEADLREVSKKEGRGQALHDGGPTPSAQSVSLRE